MLREVTHVWWLCLQKDPGGWNTNPEFSALSIGMPVYRKTAERYLAETLTASGAALSGFEIIVSDKRVDRPYRRGEAGIADARPTYPLTTRNEKNMGAIPNFQQVFELSPLAPVQVGGPRRSVSSSLFADCVRILERSGRILATPRAF